MNEDELLKDVWNAIVVATLCAILGVALAG
jgi:hypothetical protein